MLELIEGNQYRVKSRSSYHYYARGAIVTFTGYDYEGDPMFDGPDRSRPGNLEQTLRLQDIEPVTTPTEGASA